MYSNPRRSMSFGTDRCRHQATNGQGMLRDYRPKMCDRNKTNTIKWDVVQYSILLHDDGHQVPNKAARPPPSTTRAMAPRTLSLQDDRSKPVIPTSLAAPRDGRELSDDSPSSSITSTRYTLPNCSRGTVIDGRRSMRMTGRRSAASRSETVTRAPPPSDSAFCGSTSRRIRALHSPGPSDVVFGRGDEGWFARM